MCELSYFATTATPATRGIEMRGIALRGIEASPSVSFSFTV